MSFPQTTLVMFHDLLGFGSLVSNAGGRFDSKVGKIAYDRIVFLKKNLDACKSHFPNSTRFLHFNDTVVALLDIKMKILSNHHDTSGSTSWNPDAHWDILRFLAASAVLHDKIQETEDEEKIGPAGRTVLALGQRWKLPLELVQSKDDIGMLSANLAFSEAYEADSKSFRSESALGNTANFYINEKLYDELITIPSTAKLLIPEDKKDQIKYNKIQELSKDGFPTNLFVNNEEKNFTFDLFHKKRRFTALNARKVIELLKLFNDA